MLTFNNDLQLKDDLLREIIKHRKADQILQGTYGEENGTWKGCAVACSLRSLAILKGEKMIEKYDQHSRYESDLGIPESIAYLEDRIFEGLPNKVAKLWPERFTKAVPVGKDLSLITPRFMVWLMGQNRTYLSKEYSGIAEVASILDRVEELHQKIVDGKKVTQDEWSAAWSAARSVARSAESVARSAESVARSAAESAESAARSAAWSAARSAESAAESAAWSAARSVARSAAYILMANKLIDLLQEA